MMNLLDRTTLLALLAASAVLVSCQDDSDSATSEAPGDDAAVAEAAAGGVAVDEAVTSVDQRSGTAAGKPTAPIAIEYEVVGNAVVGRPVQINIEVTSSEGPVTVQYSITDASALSFQQGQVERLQIADPRSGRLQQLSVVPLREGRLFVNVSAEVETETGSMIRSMAIPLRVGKAPEAATVNGVLTEGPDGETVISLPAEESQRR